jgi:YD repeat-containing protein
MNYGIANGYTSPSCPPDCGNLQQNGLYAETRSYNARLQLTNLSVGSLSVQYRYSPNHNNGQITQQADSGQEVTYTYDSLNRLIAAVTTDSSWGQGFTYDGFGNRTSATQIKGSAPLWKLDL